MSKYRQVHTTFWNDPFIEDLDGSQKLFYLYLLTNPQTTQCGIYEISKKRISIDTGYPIDRVSELLQYCIDSGKILYSESTKELFLLNWLKHNSIKSPKILSCVKNELKNVKNTAFLERFNEICDTLSIPYAYPIDRGAGKFIEEKEEEKEEEQEKEKERAADRVSEKNCKAICKKMQKCFNEPLPSPHNVELLLSFTKDQNNAFPLDMVLKAIEIAAENNKPNTAYAKGILNNWKSKGYTTMKQVEQERAQNSKKDNQSFGFTGL